MYRITYETHNRAFGEKRVRTTDFQSMLFCKQYLNTVYPDGYKIISRGGCNRGFRDIKKLWRSYISVFLCHWDRFVICRRLN